MNTKRMRRGTEGREARERKIGWENLKVLCVGSEGKKEGVQEGGN